MLAENAPRIEMVSQGE